MINKISDLREIISMVRCESLAHYQVVLRILNMHGWTASSTFTDNYKKYPVIYIHKNVGYTTLQEVVPVTGYENISYSDIMKAYIPERRDHRLSTIKNTLTLLVCLNKEAFDKCIKILSLNGVREIDISGEWEKHPHILIKNNSFFSCSNTILDREPLASPDVIRAEEFLAVNN